MIRKNRKGKGFTTVELVIVIAVIAILAAVLIPTFASLIKKANESADIQAAKQMNTALAAESITEKPESIYDVIDILADAGFNSEKALSPVTKGCAFYWYKPENLIVLADIGEAEATAPIASILILPVSAADGDSPVSLLYPNPEDQAQDLVDDIEDAIRDLLADDDHDSNIIFDLADGEKYLEGINNGSITHVTGVTLDQPTLNMNIGDDQVTLKATLTPENPTYPDVMWDSSDHRVATVTADGLVTAVGEGTAIITVRTEEGGYEAECIVTVNHTHTKVVYHEAKAPTCTEIGWDEYVTCKECDYTTYVEKPALGHTEVIDEAVAATCTETGFTEGKHCSVCNAILVAQNVVPAKGHTPGAEATCTTAQTCTVCGITLTAAKGHTEVTDAAVAATCTKTGLTEGKHCDVCGTVIVAQSEVPLIPHTYDDKYDETCNECEFIREAECAHLNTETIPGYAPTCTATGLTDGQKCSKCKEVVKSQESIPATGHTEVTDAAVAATCTKTGLTEGKHCSVCNEVIVAQTVVDALGHNYTSVVTTPPNCTDQGYTTHTCGACGYSYKDTYVDATGHSFGDWETTIEATWTENGEQQRKCACGETETQAIEAKGLTGEISSLGDLNAALESTEDELNLKLPLTPDEPITITISEPIAIDDGKNVTIDLNKNTLTIASDEIEDIVSVLGTLTITNGDIVIERPEEEYAIYFCSGIIVEETGNLVIENANITVDRLWNIENSGTTTIKDSVITVKGGYGIGNEGTVVIENSKLVADGEATSQIYCVGGTMDIINTELVEGPNFKEYYEYTPIDVFYEGTKVTLDNVTVTTSNDVPNIDAGLGCEVVINSGTFNGVLGCTSGSTITLYGGKFGDKTFDAIYQSGAEAAKQAICAYPENSSWEVTCGNDGEKDVITIRKE